MKYNISKIRSLIATTGVTETAFLHSVGLGSKTLSRWENGTEIPREEYASFIAQKLGVDILELIFREEEAEQQQLTVADALVHNYTVDIGMLSPKQIGTDNYLRWITLLNNLDASGEKLIEYYRDDLFMQMPERNYLYRLVKDVFLMVGEVNGDKLHVDEATARTVIEYAWAKKQDQRLNKNYGLRSSGEAFRLRFEHYIARKIIEQQKKTQKMLSDDAEDLQIRKKLRRSQRPPKKETVKSDSKNKDGSHNKLKSKNDIGNSCVDCNDPPKSKENTTPVPPAIVAEPISTILFARLCRIGANETAYNLTIVADEHEQDSTKDIYWVGRALPAAVLAAIQTADRCLLYKGIKYQISDFKANASTAKYLRIISRFSNPTSPQTVYVFSQKNVAHFKQNNFEMVTAMIPCSDRVYPVPVNVYYDKAKQQYFINETTYVELRQNYGLPYLRLQIAAGQGGTQWYATLKPHSELNLLGYNVSAIDGLSTESRRKILRDAIDSGVLWKGDIINHLEWLIHMGATNPKMENAVGEWRSDLVYISKYHATEQRKIWVNKFKSRFSESNIF